MENRIRVPKSSKARRASWSAYRARNLEERREATRRYRRENPDAVRESNRRANLKRKSSLAWRLGYVLRNRVRTALKNNQKTGSAVNDLGCSIEEFKRYLESKFQPGMTWENWGVKGWHIDHIRPLSSFDLTDREQFVAACHYTNLQPLWSKEHLTKGAVYVRAA